MKQITDALAKLDPANDNHWTQDGLPRLDTIKILAGNPSLTREQVTSSAPEFNRANVQAMGHVQAMGGATLPASTESVPVAPAQATAQAAGGPVAAPLQPGSPPLTAAPLAEVEDSLDVLRAQLSEAMLQLSDKKDSLQRATQELADAQNAIGAIEDKIGVLSKTSENPIMGYLARQRVVLEERGARKQLIKESGLNLKQLAKDLKAPIDAAMERRSNRGAMRPAKM